MSEEPTETVSNAELHAYVDGRLDDTRRQAVEAHLAADAEAAARVAAYEAQNAALRELFDPVLNEPVPGRLGPPRASRRAVHAAWAAAAAVLLVVGGVGGWFAGKASRLAAEAQIAVAHQAAVAHAVFTPQKRHPVEVGGDEEAHLVKWLSKVLGQTLRAPNLNGLGYALVGGRLLSATDGPAAQFMYEDKGGQRLTLYVVTSPRLGARTQFRFTNERGVAVFHWIDGPVGYALAAKIERDALLRIARAVYAQLEP